MLTIHIDLNDNLTIEVRHDNIIISAAGSRLILIGNTTDGPKVVRKLIDALKLIEGN